MQNLTEPQKSMSFERIIADWPENTASHQRARLLEAMRVRGAITTLEAMRFLDIVDPRARVVELRKEGYHINTSWVVQPSESGGLHTVGLYTVAANANRATITCGSKSPRDWTNRQMVLAF